MFHRDAGAPHDPDIEFGIIPLEVTPEQLSYWEDHPREVRMFRHTEETVRMVRGQSSTPLREAMFAFRMPFDLPVPDGAAFGLRRSPDQDEPIWVMLVVRRIKIELAAATLAPYERGLAALLGQAKPRLRRGSSGQTWILAYTINAGYEDEPFEIGLQPGGGLSIGFERCLRAINIVCDASRLVGRDPYSRPLTKESLDPSITWFDVDIETERLGGRHEMRLHRRVYNPRTIAENPQEMHQRLSIAVSRRLESDAAAHPHPLLMPRLLAFQAESQRWYGEASSAIITLQTAAETLLAGLYRLLLVDQGLGSEAIEDELHASFKMVLRRHLPDALKGRWTGSGTVPERYWTDVYDLRNDLVHAGKVPAWWKINAAFEAYDALVEFVDQSVLSGWRNHPRALLGWCEEWAGGTLALPRAARNLAETLRAEEHPYWLPADLAGRSGSSSK